MATTIVEVNDVSKRFRLRKETSIKERVLHPRRKHIEEFWALRNVSLDIEAGTTVGLVGANGSGKSTLLKTIGAIIQPTSGTVRHRGRIAALLELGAGFHQDLTGRENVFLNGSILGMSKQETARRFDEIVEFSGIEDFIDTQVKFYSSGMYVRLAFAVAVHVDPDLLLVDEVLAVGDEPFQRKCMDRIREFQAEGRTIVLVSHSAEQVGELCTRAVLLRHGRVVEDAPPAVTLRALRSGFEEDRVVEEVRHHRVVEHAQITAVELLDERGAPAASFATGEPVTVRLHVDPRGRLDDWMAAISLETNLGQALFRFNTQTVGMRLPAISEPTTIDFDLPSIPLGEGSYVLNAGIGNGAGATIHRIPAAATLAVRGPFSGTGVLGIVPTIVPGRTATEAAGR